MPAGDATGNRSGPGSRARALLMCPPNHPSASPNRGWPKPEGEMLLIIIIILLLLWTPGYYGYGRSRWGMGFGGDILTLILVIVLIWALLGR